MQNDEAKNHKRMRISYAAAIAASQRPKRNSNLNLRHEDDPNDAYCDRCNSIYTKNIVNHVLLSHKVLLPVAGSCVIKTSLWRQHLVLGIWWRLGLGAGFSNAQFYTDCLATPFRVSGRITRPLVIGFCHAYRNPPTVARQLILFNLYVTR